MAYSRTNWENDVTPLNATNMNNIEDGIQENKAAIAGKVSQAQMEEYAVPIKTTVSSPDLYNVSPTPFVYGHINSAGTETETTFGLAYDDSSISALEGSFKIPVMDQDGMLRSAGVVGTLPENGGKVLPNCDNVNSMISNAQESLVQNYVSSPSSGVGSINQVLAISGYEDYFDNTTGQSVQYASTKWIDLPKTVRGWSVSVTKDGDVTGSFRFWSTAEPNSATNPTNIQDLFNARVGDAYVTIVANSAEYRMGNAFAYNAETGYVLFMYYPTYPYTGFTEASLDGTFSCYEL